MARMRRMVNRDTSMDVLLRWEGIWWGSEEVEGAGERRGVCSAMVYGGRDDGLL